MGNKHKITIQSAILTVIPITFIGISLFLRHQRGPYWLFSNSDPEYAYLLNSLNVIQSNPLGHTEHPGTLVHILGAFIIGIVYVFQAITGLVDGTIIEAVLKEPELYLKAINSTFLFLIGISVFLAGQIALVLSRSLIPSLILQSPCFLFTALEASYRISPEPVLFLISQILAIILLFYIYQPTFDRSKKFAALLGIMFGLGLATKYTFLPTILFILLVPTIRQKLITIGTTIVTFVLSTIPIIPQYPKTFSWLYGVLTRTGYYGTGEPGFVDFQTAKANFQILYAQDKVFFQLTFISIAVFILLGILLKVWNPNSFTENESEQLLIRRSYFLLGCLLLIAVVQFVPTLKQPGIRYLISSISLSGLMIFIQVNLIQNFLIEKYFPGLKLKVFPFLLLVACVAIAISSTSTYSRIVVSQFSLYQSELSELQNLIALNYSDCNQVTYFRSSSQEYALKFGDDLALRSFSNPLKRLYPESFFYNIWSRQFESFNQLVDIKTLLNTKCTLLRGAPWSGYDELYLPSLELETLFEGKGEAVYRIISTK
ncbi:hypothetical protein H6G89_24900 [Oscillatoria sp. FACHB-1407]|uniref:hypothetical protein n=1 Tax=Oscillatoria sp. FACHB-1407 TaxID=2692847 RepID=UPI0016845421|nr:hypothetical protein [Oscillatoria sp. FACHB-1407]MBD2464247.1 hypothetical protein [Oscillatoria sp. FACHB-1407]